MPFALPALATSLARAWLSCGARVEVARLQVPQDARPGPVRVRRGRGWPKPEPLNP